LSFTVEFTELSYLRLLQNSSTCVMKCHEESLFTFPVAMKLLVFLQLKKWLWDENTLEVFLSIAGMNAAVRATVRVGLYTGAKVFFVHEVYWTS